MLGKPSRRAQERLAQHGRRATAAVLEVSGRGSLTVGNPGVTTNTALIRKVRLRVEPEDEPAFEVTVKMRFLGGAPIEGSKISVIYDPQDHGTVMADES